jgi:hypothetical protein
VVQVRDARKSKITEDAIKMIIISEGEALVDQDDLKLYEYHAIVE